MQPTQQRSEPINVLRHLRIALVPGRAKIARHENAAFRIAAEYLRTDAGLRDQLQYRSFAVPIDLQIRCGLIADSHDEAIRVGRHEPAAVRQSVLDRLDAADRAGAQIERDGSDLRRCVAARLHYAATPARRCCACSRRQTK